MKKQLITALSFLSLSLTLVLNSGCSSDFSVLKSRKRGAPQSATDTGYLIQSTNDSEVARAMKANPNAKFRSVYRPIGLYEVFGVQQNSLKNFFPTSKISKNKFVETLSVKPLNWKTLAAETAKEDPRLNECLESEEFPTAKIESLAPSQKELDSAVLERGTKLNLNGLNSAAHKFHPGKLKMAWIVLHAPSSLEQETVVFGSKLEFKADAYGLYQIALVVQDSRNVCGGQILNLTFTGNPEFKEDIQPNMENFDLSAFTHLERIGAKQSWKKSQGANVLIAVIDTGVNYNHSFLNQKMELNTLEIPGDGIDNDGNKIVDDYVGYDFFNDDPSPFDDHGHGSHVSGLASGFEFGMAQSAKILAVKAFGTQGGDIGSIVGAIHYSIQRGANIINMSFGNYGETNEIMIEAIGAAEKAGILLVAASGNGNPATGFGVNTDEIPNYPSSFSNENILSVAASGINMSLATYSNFGEKTVDIAAPGGSGADDLMLSCTLDNPRDIAFVGMAGTSMAAPVVAGIAAQVWSLKPSLSAVEVRQILLESGTTDPLLKGMVATASHLNALLAVENVMGAERP